jgi:hypothetical protein
LQVQATNTELDKSIRETMEITRIALNNDWTTAKNAKILQRHEAGKSLEDRAIKMTEDEKRKKEKGESTPAKRRRDGESVGLLVPKNNNKRPFSTDNKAKNISGLSF